MTTSTWELGDHTVNRLGYGAMRLTTRPLDRDQAISVLRRAVELGVNHIDTASFYFSPLLSANELINSALRPYPSDLVITTKVGPGRDPSGEWHRARPEQLRGQVEENLRQLGVDHLDVVNLRIGASLERGTGSIAEEFGVLAELRQEGLIRHLGISNVGAEHLAEARAIAPVVCVQNLYGLGAREDDALLDLCGEQGVAFVPFFSVDRAAPEDTLAEISAAHGVTPAQVMIAWTLHRGSHVLAIPGTGDPEHLEQNVEAARIKLSAEEMARLSRGPGPGTPAPS
ncbi:oxidoreductase [Allokutzneria sp. A3M-2-11 16]|uniref:oxidoreductase n=1 Tax=Allokutzneria sp. A3M-2-11 16 TaxID=2962043 RepID=UPI0020B83FAC|nr:oxidoreductase [Allokutzneria sp. A3M-2-11 16]MCP3802853.1 oxidoreductase [Allokutzneria sp. A3M-2-11 16]